MKKITNDLNLLELMIEDQNHQKDIHKPGTYWKQKARISHRLIKKYGLDNFRNYVNLIGESFTDMVHIDYRNTLEEKSIIKRILFLLFKKTKFKNLFDNQVHISIQIYNLYLEAISAYLLNHPRYIYLKNKYLIKNSIDVGNPVENIFDNSLNSFISLHYVNLLDQHDYLTEKINFKNYRTIFEIGGGFGVNCHLLIQNYPNIKKIIYLDIPPNLYIGTQYLKAFYGEAVIDYSNLKNKNKLKFKADSSLEIFCIAPWQIENIENKVDLLFNSHSFVEMPTKIVEYYVKNILKEGNEKTDIALISYDKFDLKSTFHPDELPNYFPKYRNWEKFKQNSLTKPDRYNYFYISKIFQNDK